MLRIIIALLFIIHLAQSQTRFQVGVNVPNASFVTGESILDLPNGDLMVYPNPVTNDLNVKVEFEEPTDVQYILTDVSGRKICK